MNLRALMALLFALIAPAALAGEIVGIWKHADEPGWMQISVDGGVATGTVVRNDIYPDRVGRELLKGLASDEGETEVWRGQVYAERLGEYRDAQVSLPEPDALQIRVKVGFMSRTISWARVEKLPTE